MADHTPIVVPKKGLSNVALIMACGTALFSDGYINGVIGSVNTILKKLYPVETKLHNHGTIFSSIGFAGIVVGQLTFGWFSDLVGRKNGMFVANAIVFVFVALSAGAYGAGGSINGMLAALSAYRFLSGIGIGAEYPAGSVAAAENTEQPGVNKTRQQMWFALATNSGEFLSVRFERREREVEKEMVFETEKYALAIFLLYIFDLLFLPPYHSFAAVFEEEMYADTASSQLSTGALSLPPLYRLSCYGSSDLTT
jgi:MFS family permease